MQAIVNGRFLKAEERSFVNDKGENVAFYRVQFLDEDCEPIELTCSREVFESREVFDKLAPVSILLTIRQMRNQIRVRVDGMQIA